MNIKNTSKPKSQKKAQLSDRLFQIRAKIRRDSVTLKGAQPTAGGKGAVTNLLNNLCGGNDQRKILLSWLFVYNDVPPLVPISSKQLSGGQWYALTIWIGANPDDNWEPSEDFRVECEIARKAAMSAFSARLEDYDIVDPDDLVTKAAIGLGGNIRGEDA